MVSRKVLRIGIQKTPLQKTYQMAIGAQSFNIDFLGANRQFDWLEISLTYDKSDKYNTICDSYNVEKDTTFIKLLELKNISEGYSLTNQMKYDVTNKTQKHLLYKQFVTWNCDGCSIAPLTDCINNPIYQELPTEEQYFTTSDDRLYLDLKDSRLYTNEIEKLTIQNLF